MSKGEVASSGGGESADLALANRRSRSRGRTPSELLARKQRLASAGRMPLDGADQQDQRKMANGSNQNESDYQPLSAEAKLESLSALLRHHQVSSMELGDGDETTSTQNQHQEQLKSVDDVYILLAKKEKDLQLAAELGKVLLERNEDLSRANERIAEEYSHKLELLEQEKHKLKRKLDQLDGEYENRLIELQTDCNILKNKLEQQQQAGKQAEKEKSKLIEDLVQQNQRLTSELAEATRSEELLASQLEQVNERLSSRLSNRSNHVAQVDALQEEIQILNQRKQDLERRLKLAQGDKSNLNGVIDELGDKILLCENLLNEKDLKIGELAIEISELRDSSAWLSARLESMISLNERLVASVAVNSDSEHNVTDLTAISERDRSQLVEQLKELRLRRSSRIKANELILAEADERRRRSLMKPASRLQGSARGRTRRKRGGRDEADECSLSNDNDSTIMSDNELDLDSETSRGGDLQPATRQQNLSELISEIFFIISNFLAALQQRKESLQISTGGGGGSSSSHHQTNGQNQQQHSPNEDSGIGSSADELKVQEQFQRSTGDKSTSSSLAQTTTSSSATFGSGANDLEQWRRLINEVRQLIEELPCSSCQLMIGERSDFEQLRRTHTKLNEEIRLKNDELLKFTGQNIELNSQLSVLQDKCRLLKEELESCDRPTDEIVKQAWKTRDEAVSRKNNAEIQLAKTRIENMQISSQLMEVVQQKGELSQKLAQFEDDIHYMMQRSVRQRFSWEEYAEEARRNGAARSKSRQSNGTGNVRMTTANQLINLVPSIVSSNGNAQGSSSIQQLLSLTGVNLLTPTKTKGPDKSLEQHHISQDATSNGSIVTSSSQLDGLGEQNKSAPTATQNNLLTSLKSGTNRFNLRFWQRNNSSQESEQTPDKMIVDSVKS